MDYQASSSSCKEIAQKGIKSIILCIVGTATLFSTVFAQTTTNPLTVDVTISANVLVGPGVYPDTPPSPPGPVNMSENIDAAIFKGVAYPGSTIAILRNGIVIAEIPAQQDGTFDVRVRNIGSGTYTFGVRAKDTFGIESRVLSFTIFISSGIATVVEGIFIPPTITTDKIEVKKYDTIKFFGSAYPNSEIRLSLIGNVETIKKALTNASGTWEYILDTTPLSFGEYDAKARFVTATSISAFSESISFRIGNTNRERGAVGLLGGFRKRCDLNGDNRVNLLDFSIMAFWYKRLGFPEKVDLNSDKNVNLTDLSILAYCWTG